MGGVYLAPTTRRKATRAGKLLAGLVVALATFAPGPARAGGSTISFDRPFILAGEMVSASGRFGTGSNPATVDDGPFFAYLDSLGAGPVDHRLLAPVSITEVAMGGWRASMTFAVPSVPTGQYLVAIENRAGEAVGDLIGGWTVIANTPVEGRVLLDLQKARFTVRTQAHRIDTLINRQQAGRDAIADREATINAQAVRLENLGNRIDQLEGQLEGQLVGQLVARDGSMPLWPFALMVAVAVGLAALAYRIGRRHPRWPRGAGWPIGPPDSDTSEPRYEPSSRSR